MAAFTSFLAKVRRELEETTASVWSDTSLLDWTNEAIEDFSVNTKAFEDEQYVDTVAAQRAYDLPDGTLEVRMLTYNGTPIGRETIESVAGENALTATGTPTSFAISGGAVYLRPIPNLVKQIRFFRYYQPDRIASTTATTDMPLGGKYDRVLKHYVKASAYEQLGEDGLRLSNDEWSKYLSQREEAANQVRRERNATMAQMPSEVW